MTFLLEQSRLIIESVIMALGYPGIALVMLVENLFPPIPSEIVVPFAGFLVGRGKLNFTGVMVAATFGAVLGALVLYGLGAWLGEERLRALVRRYGRWTLVSERDFDNALTIFSRHERSVVFWARLMPGIRSLISIPAGVVRMRLGRFLLFTTLGTLVWNLILGVAGVVLGQNWGRVLALVDRYEIVVWGVLGALVAVWLGRQLILKNKHLKNKQKRRRA